MADCDRDKARLDSFTGSLVLVGAGKMGRALLQGWLRLGLEASRVVVLEPQPSADIAARVKQGLRLNPLHSELDRTAAIVVAVKPQNADEVIPRLAGLVRPDTVIVSIMAGRTLAGMASLLPEGSAIVRAMPNTPAAIGRGITVAVGNAHVTPVQRTLADDLLAATGSVEWMERESLMDAVTAVSGSGPAYLFLLAEALAEAGTAAGLPPELAAKLARETVAGAGELMRQSELDPAKLRRNVTSPGGTTAAALDVLMAADGLPRLIQAAVEAAARRSRELAG